MRYHVVDRDLRGLPPREQWCPICKLQHGLAIFSGCNLSHCRHIQEKLNGISLKSVREFLTREEDSIVFSLIERAKYPYNAPVYDPSYLGFTFHNHSLIELFVRETEALQAKAGRYQNPEEVPFFPEDLILPLVPPYKYPQELHPVAASVNVSTTIWHMYFDRVLPQFTSKGNDGKYAQTAEADLICLQALSRRIHYGRFVAEVKFRAAPKDYITAIKAKDSDGLMRLLTSASQEEIVKRRVEEKAKVFGQDVTLDTKGETTSNHSKYKVDPMVVYSLYSDWVIPLTKLVEVEYLLHRLD
ncbi:chorismate mutase 2-like [Canna indica]|uniref:Chorismate mutase n=1 Tax=Canna indica TaxID=4628 RepID=A0AAQ3L3D8_9LILI|nr:chorismate mutase 2-like [Canna indica]